MDYKQPEVMISSEEIQKRVQEMGAKITADYSGRKLDVVGVLRGSFIFMADLVRHIDLPLSCDFLGLSSYGDSTKSSGVVAITKDLSDPVEGKDILIIEDIIDTGLTMAYLLENLSTRKPASVKVASLLSKPSRRQVTVGIDYLGFTIEDRFVVGYGLDYAGVYRNLPFIGAME